MAASAVPSRNFWDAGSFYASLAGGSATGWRNAGIAAAVGVAGGAAAALAARSKSENLDSRPEPEDKP